MGIAGFNLGELVAYKSEFSDDRLELVYCVKYKKNGESDHSYASQVVIYLSSSGAISKIGEWYSITRSDYELGGGTEIHV